MRTISSEMERLGQRSRLAAVATKRLGRALTLVDWKDDVIAAEIMVDWVLLGDLPSNWFSTWE